MPTTKYVGEKTAVLYEESTGSGRAGILIFGDEVEVSGGESDGRVQARARDMKGWMKTGALREDPVLELYFIDVGQGDATFIVTPARKKISDRINGQAHGFLAGSTGLIEGS